jgi:hypothetical protein
MGALNRKGIEKIAKAIVDHERGKWSTVELEQVIINALGIPHPSIIFRVPALMKAEDIERFKAEWNKALNQKGTFVFDTGVLESEEDKEETEKLQKDLDYLNGKEE